jgi:hypothetical protein
MDSRSNRRSDRISISFTLEAMGTDAQGRPFLETARTVVVNRHGALVALNHKLRAGQQVTVRRRVTDGSIRQTEVRVVAIEKETEKGGEYGVSFVDPDLDFWGIEFPAPERSIDAVVRLLVECTHCRTQELAYLDSRELKEFEANHLFARQCRICEAPTVWKQPLESMSRGGDHGAHHHGAGAGTPERETTRYETRLTACVRQKPGTEEMAVCENVSRQGVAFRTKNRYEEGAHVEVAVPYTPGMANVFVPAVVIHVRSLPSAGLYRHGAKYIRKDGTAS